MEKQIRIETTCPLCGEKHYVEVIESDYIKFKRGEHVQNVFPYLKSSDRELLITGIDNACWEKIMANDDLTESIEEA